MNFSYYETFARKMISLSGQAKTHGMREFMLINDRLSTFLTQYAGEMAFVQRSHYGYCHRQNDLAYYELVVLCRLPSWGFSGN